MSAPIAETLPRRVGILVPSGNTTCEAELNRAGLAGLSFHCARMALPSADDDATMVAQLRDNVVQPLGDLARCRLDAAVLACTSASMALGPEAAMALMGASRAARIIDVGSAIIAALKSVGLARIALFTPYREETNRRVIDYLAAHGIATTAALGLGLNTSAEMFAGVSRMTASQLAQHFAGLDHAAADGVLICCTDLPTVFSLPMLEKRIGKPVVSSNQAMAWAIARALNEPTALGGRLFAAA